LLPFWNNSHVFLNAEILSATTISDDGDWFNHHFIFLASKVPKKLVFLFECFLRIDIPGFLIF
jgi:hypothetical protein